MKELGSDIFNYPTGYLILRHFPAKISNSILMIFLSSVVARWGPKSAQIEKCKVETLLVGPFHIGFKGKKWVLGVFSMSHPYRSGPGVTTPRPQIDRHVHVRKAIRRRTSTNLVETTTNGRPLSMQGLKGDAHRFR